MPYKLDMIVYSERIINYFPLFESIIKPLGKYKLVIIDWGEVLKKGINTHMTTYITMSF